MMSCTKCGETKPIACFVERSGARRGTYYRHCRVCRAIALTAWRKANSQRRSEQEKRQYQQHREERIAKARAWCLANPGRRLATVKAWSEENKERLAELYRRNSRRWATANPAKRRAYNAKRKAIRLNAMPAWANESAISEIYELARQRSKVTGVEWQVDHVVPLQGALVCGLHVEGNLQVIQAAQNRRKSNHFPDVP